MSVLIIQPEKCKDPAINFARECALEVLRRIPRTRIQVRIIRGRYIKRDTLVDTLSRSNGARVAFLGFGHGTEDYLADTGKRCIFHKDDASVLRNKICYILACYTFRGLGAEAIRQGAAAYVGFSDQFIVPHYFKPLMIQCCTKGIIGFLKQEWTSAKIREKTVEAFEEAIKNLEEEDLTRYSQLALFSKIAFSHNISVFGFSTDGSDYPF